MLKELRRELRAVLTVFVVLVLVLCALMMPGLYEVERVILLLFVAVTTWVFNACESRVERANAPLIIRDESGVDHSHPPENGDE